jgi:hypothetical protein
VAGSWVGHVTAAPRYAAETEVSPEKSRQEIERTVKRYGADEFAYGERADVAVILFRYKGRRVRFAIERPTDHDVQRYPGGRWRATSQYRAAREQLERQRWRVLLLTIKAKLEAVEAGAETAGAAFLPYTILPNGETVGEWIDPQIDDAYATGQMPPLLPALPAPRR